MAEDQPISDTQQEQDLPVGERLRAARTAQKLSLDDVASQTRIPLRHLEAIEASEWDKLPAPTYTIGFAKSYASAVGLDRAEIGESLREEIGNPRPSAMAAEVFEPVDPARTMPRWLVVSAIIAVVFVVIALSWLNERSLQPEETETPIAAVEDPAPPASAGAQPGPAAAAPAGPVTINAVEPVWIQVSERGGRTLFQGELTTGQRYQVPQDATAPVLRTGKPEGLRVMVGTTEAPQIGPPARTVSNVSLLAGDLLGQGAAAPR